MSRISKIVSGVGVILALLGAAGAPAEAAAIYTVNRPSIGPVLAHITGELVTDGTLGILSNANFVDWNLTIASAAGTDTLLGYQSGINSFLVVAGNALTATPDGLYFDFGVIGLVWITNTGLLHTGSFWCLERSVGVCNVNTGETVGSKSVEGFVPRIGNVKIATLKSIDVDVPDVPEPASVLLLTTGALAVLRRRRGRTVVGAAFRRPVGSTRPDLD